MKKVGSETRVFAGFFSPTNQQIGEIIKDKSESDLKKLLFRNFPSTTTNAFSKRQDSSKPEGQTAAEQSSFSNNKSVYEFKTDRRRISDEFKENHPNKTLRKFPSEQTEIELPEVDQLRREVDRLK